MIRVVFMLAFWGVSILIVGPLLLLYATHQWRHQVALLEHIEGREVRHAFGWGEG